MPEKSAPPQASPKRNRLPQVTSRSVLSVLLVSAQLICLLAGLLLFANLFIQRLDQVLRAAVLEHNRQIARQAAAFIQDLDPRWLQPGNRGWAQLQRIVERFQLPSEGYLCIVDDRTGEPVWYPGIETDALSSADSSAAVEIQQLMAVAEAGILQDQDNAGWVSLPDGKHVIAICSMPELALSVIAQQRESGVLAVMRHIVVPLLPIGLTTVLLVTCLTMAMALAVISRYEHRLAETNENLERLVIQRTNALTKTRNATIFGLAKLAESRDTDTGDHLDRIRSFVTILARKLQSHNPMLTDEYIETLGIASSLHDIGKVGIPDEVLLKPGKLTTAERAIMETHAAIGAECLAAIMERLGEDDFLTLAYEIALWHHEKFDGTGYPTQLSGTQIPLSARIVALADVYDALISPRVYKRPMSHEQARNIILEGTSKHFDPEVITAFLESESEFKAITQAFHARLNGASTRHLCGCQQPAPSPDDAGPSESEATGSSAGAEVLIEI